MRPTHRFPKHPIAPDNQIRKVDTRLTQIQNNNNVAHLVAAMRGSAGIFLVRVAGTGLGFVVGVLLAQLLGVEGLGVVAYASAWTNILLIACTLGFQQLLPREIARYHSQGEWGLFRGVLAFSQASVLAVSVLMAGMAALAAWIITGFETQSMVVVTLWIVLIGVPFSSLTQVRQGVMRGLGHVVRGQIPEILVAPLLSCTVLGILYLADYPALMPYEAVSIIVAVTIVAFLIGNRMLKAVLPAGIRAAEPVTTRRAWLVSAVPMVMITGLEVVNSQTDIVMLGAIATEKETGIYSVASRGAMLVVFVWASVNTAIGPIIARTFYNGQYTEMQNLVRKSATGIFVLTLPVCAALYFLGEEFLSLFGPEFVAGKTSLDILLIGNLVIAVAGSVGLILKMTGHERDVMWAGVVAAVINIALNAVLIPRFGAEGAATATAISMSTWALASCVIVYLRLGINPTVFGPQRLMKSNDRRL